MRPEGPWPWGAPVADDADLAAGREALLAGREAIALEHLTGLAEEGSGPARSVACALAAEACLRVGRPHEAIAWAEQLRSERPGTPAADLLEARARTELGDAEAALDLLDRIDQHHPDVGDETLVADPDGGPGRVAEARGHALLSLGKRTQAASEVAEALADDWRRPGLWRLVATLGATHDLDPSAAVATLPDDGVLEVLGWLVGAPPAGADRVLEALWGRSPGDRRVLAMLAAVGDELAVERALEWSGRLRAAGAAGDCPLVGAAANPNRDPRERLRAATVASAVFGDGRATTLVEEVVRAVGDDDLAGALDELLALGGDDDLAAAFLAGAATTASRARELARALRERGADEAADALSAHASGLAAGGG